MKSPTTLRRELQRLADILDPHGEYRLSPSDLRLLQGAFIALRWATLKRETVRPLDLVRVRQRRRHVH